MRLALPFVCIVALLVAVHARLEPMWMTGDEPRYVSQGLGIYSRAALEPDARTWGAFVARSALPPKPYPFAAVAGERAPSLGPSIAFGAPLRFFDLDVARWANFAVAAAGLLALVILLRARFSSGANASPAVVSLVLAIVAFSIPFIEYARLLYPEALLFATTACALLALATNRRIALAFAAGLLPFEHIRGLPLSLTFMLLLFWSAVRAKTAQRSVAREGLIYVALLAAWAVLDLRVYGSVSGPAFSTHAAAFATYFTRLGVQLFDVRHGLLIYSPIYFLAFAGIAAGCIARDSGCRRAALLLAVYVTTFAWSSAGESWSARFWTPALPMLALGLAYWLTFARSLAGRIALVLLGAITLANTIIYSLHPMWFVQNRTHSLSYAALGAFVHLDLGAPLVSLDAGPGDALRATTLLAATALGVLALVAIGASTARAPAPSRARAPRSARALPTRKR